MADFNLNLLGENENIPVKPGEKFEILYEGYFYDVTNWVDKHPGGNIIKYYNGGEDATIPFQQFHNRSLKKSFAILNSLKKRKQEENEMSKNSKHDELTSDYLKLYEELKSEGLFEPSISYIILRFGEILLYFLIACWAAGKPGVFYSFLGCLGYFGVWSRCLWLMHDAGHRSLTGNSKVDRFLHSFSIGWGIGLSSVWWCGQHNKHHAMPNRLHHDIDIHLMPLLCYHEEISNEKYTGRNFITRNQNSWPFILIAPAVVMFVWKIHNIPKYILRRKAYLDAFFIITHYVTAYYLLGGFWKYIFLSWITSLYFLINSILNHTHLPVTSEAKHWIEATLHHTADITPHWFVDWWMGYLNYQIEHHLFPTMPQFKNKYAKKRVIQLAKKHNIRYYSYPYFHALYKTRKNLQKVSEKFRT